MNIRGVVAIVLALAWSARAPAAASAPDLKNLYHPIVQDVASRHRIDPALIHAIIQAESNYERFAVSEKGAMGLMQLMPATAGQYGVNNIFDPRQNIEGGTKYLKDLIKLYNGQANLVLAAYNAGQEAVRRFRGIPPYKETRDYIQRVQATYKKPTIEKRTVIYKFIDSNGRVTLTDDPDYVRRKKGP